MKKVSVESESERMHVGPPFAGVPPAAASVSEWPLPFAPRFTHFADRVVPSYAPHRVTSPLHGSSVPISGHQWIKNSALPPRPPSSVFRRLASVFHFFASFVLFVALPKPRAHRQ